MSAETTTRAFEPLPAAFSEAPDAAEKEILEGWRRAGTFRAVQKRRAGAEPFVFWEGPPTANGRPGIHHLMARTIKDAICRFHTMLGRRVERKAGWDTHGLPVELEVEKALGISGKPQIEKYGIGKFNAKCRESVWTYKQEWEELSERIGFWLDYEDPYVTYDADYVESVWSLLKRFHEAGLVYRGERVLPWCGRCGTGLSSHELGQPGAYRDVQDPSVTLRFRLREPSSDEPESLLAWTTTPWTLPSNFALAVHPEHMYVRARLERDGASETVWVVRERAAAVLGDAFEIVEERPGKELVGLEYRPLFEHPRVAAVQAARDPGLEKIYRVYAADFVTTEDGTGIVHQAPYGDDDWRLAQQYGIDTAWFRGVGQHGRFVVDIGPVETDTFFKDADRPLIRDLRGRGLMFHDTQETHSYPHCWRCDTPLFYFPAPAWYIRTTRYKERMIELNRRIRWVPPEVGQKRFGEWLENNIDWNISRDRFWGTPLPFWVCNGRDDKPSCDLDIAIGSVADLRDLAGTLPEGFDNHKPLIDEVTFDCPKCGGEMRRTPSVLDCWFDSGAMPYAQYHWPIGSGSEDKLRDQFPASFIAEGLDQTRGWFYTLHAIGAFVTNPEFGSDLPDGPAYQTCVVNGLVLDKDGVKMSKRLGNIVNPWEAIAVHGVDALRWYLMASGALWLPKRFDLTGVLETRRRFISTLINSYKFFAEYARLDGFDPQAESLPPVEERPEIDRWLVSRTQSLVREVRERFENYDLSGGCRRVERFVVEELSNWYIRRNRRRLWKSETGPDKLGAFASLHAALHSTALLIAPVAPFLAEALWRRLDRESPLGSVHELDYPRAEEQRIDQELERSMALVEKIVSMGRALRERSGLRVRQPLRALHVRSSDLDGLSLLRGAFASEQILDELNIKGWGSLEADDGKLCSLRARPNFRVLGKRLGPRMKAAAAAISGLGAESVARLQAGQSVALEVDGEELEIDTEAVEVRVEIHADFDVETDGEFVVFLDTQLDDELLAEGLAREVVNRVNGLRKDSGLAVEERIELRLGAGGDALLLRALEDFGGMIGKETLAERLEVHGEALGGSPSSSWDLGGGRSLSASLVRS